MQVTLYKSSLDKQDKAFCDAVEGAGLSYRTEETDQLDRSVFIVMASCGCVILRVMNPEDLDAYKEIDFEGVGAHEIEHGQQVKSALRERLKTLLTERLVAVELGEGLNEVEREIERLKEEYAK